MPTLRWNNFAQCGYNVSARRWNNMKTTLHSCTTSKQPFTTLIQRCINTVSTLCKVVSTLCNVVSTLFQRRALALHQCWTTLEIRRPILLHFQRQINDISTLIHNSQGWSNVDPTLKCWLGITFSNRSNC